MGVVTLQNGALVESNSVTLTNVMVETLNVISLYGPELISNGGFTLDSNSDGLPDYWLEGEGGDLTNCSIVTGNGHVGNALRADALGATQRAWAFTNSGLVDLVAGRRYKVSFWYRSATILAEGSSAHINLVTLPANTGDAQYHELEFTADGDEIGFGLYNFAVIADNWWEISNLSVKEVLTNTVVPSGATTVKGSTNDGTTNIFTGMDSNEVTVFGVDTNGVVQAGGYKSSDGSAGITASTILLDANDSNYYTHVFKNGILTSKEVV